MGTLKNFEKNNSKRRNCLLFHINKGAEPPIWAPSTTILSTNVCCVLSQYGNPITKIENQPIHCYFMKHKSLMLYYKVLIASDPGQSGHDLRQSRTRDKVSIKEIFNRQSLPVPRLCYNESKIFAVDLPLHNTSRQT